MKRQSQMIAQRDDKLTQAERRALGAEFNLADGHARQTCPAFWSAYQEMDMRTMQQLRQTEAEAAFRQAFRDLLHQDLEYHGRSQLLLPSASLSLELVASSLRLSRATLLAPSPCFDNVIDIFRHHEVPTSAYCVDGGDLDDVVEAIRAWTGDAVLVVAPGNPTGMIDTADDLRTVVEAVAATGGLLILDASFRAFSESLSATDTYAMLRESGTRYIAIEDTGKFASSFEMKVSVLSADDETYASLEPLYDDLMVCHSGLVLQVLARTLGLIGRQGVEEIRQLIAANRHELWRNPIDGLRRPASRSVCSVEWVEVDGDPEIIVGTMARAGVQTLAGGKFYWDQDNDVPRRVRVALLRDPSYFAAALRRLR
jgi:aspartate/methionine/tyrosine aminotransferase